MASSSSSHQPNEEHPRFSENEASREIRAVEKSPKVYDVFINHRGPDVKNTLASELYNSLQNLGIKAFLDSKEKEIGCLFDYTIQTAIRSATVHIAIFSTGYAESYWCLEELLLMLDTTALIIPVFYGTVEPSHLRHVESGNGLYNASFATHRNKQRHTKEKIEAWKAAMHKISFTAGFKSNEYKNSSDLCENIVSKVKEEVERKEPIYVAEHPVGLDELVEDFERFYQSRKKEKGQANIVAITGIGGIGKSTLARELFNRKRSKYDGACFLSNVRENYVKVDLPALQCKLLKDLLRENHPKFGCREDGISQIKKSWYKVDKNLRFLIVLDDVNHLDQLEAFPILETLGKSLAIVTTREKDVLTSARISVPYNLGGMSPEYRRQLFCWHAFRQYRPATGYEEVVEAFTDACRGLPLYLRVLGKHIVNKNLKDCLSALNKYKSTLHEDITKTLKISVETLDREEKTLFMDIACFFVDKSKNVAIRVWEGCGWNASHALTTLKQKGLVEDSIRRWDPVLTMHDLLRDLGREMAEAEHPRRIWRQEHLRMLERMGFQNILEDRERPNWRCFQSILDRSMDAQITYFLGNSDSLIERSASLLWLELDFKGHTHESIPPWIPLQNLQYLRIIHGLLKRLWQSDQVPSSLKELQISQTTFSEEPYLSAMSNHLEKLLVSLDNMPIEGWSFLESLILNPRSLVLRSSGLAVECRMLDFNNRGQPLTVGCRMGSLQKLEIFNQNFVTKVMVTGFHYPNIKSLVLNNMKGLIELDLKMVSSLNNLDLTGCKNLKIVSGISDLANLVTLNIYQCSELEELPCLADLSCLQMVTICGCEKLNHLELRRCENLKSVVLASMKNLVTVDLKRLTKLSSLKLNDCGNCKSVSGIYELANLKTLIIDQCSELEDLSCLADMSCLQTVRIGRCEKLSSLEFHRCKNLKSVVLSSMENLVTVDLKRVPALSSFKLYDCKKIKSVSGITDLANLVTLDSSQCSELEELSCLADLSCLRMVTIDRCENLIELDLKMVTSLNNLELTNCKALKIVSGISCLANLDTLKINQCSELEELQYLADLSCLQTVTIGRCDKLNRLELHRCENLKSVIVSSMENLLTVDLKGVTALNSLQLNDCQNCKTVSGISDLPNLVNLNINQCSELEQLPCLAHLSCLQTVTIGGCEKLNCLEFADCEKLKTVEMRFLPKLIAFSIRHCPELEKLPCLVGLSCLQRIIIDGCGKLKSLELRFLKQLKSLKGVVDLTELEIAKCPELQELPNLACLEKLTIKLQDISCIEDLPASKKLQLLQCSNMQSYGN